MTIATACKEALISVGKLETLYTLNVKVKYLTHAGGVSAMLASRVFISGSSPSGPRILNWRHECIVHTLESGCYR
jgi:hypothetical protein